MTPLGFAALVGVSWGIGIAYGTYLSLRHLGADLDLDRIGEPTDE